MLALGTHPTLDALPAVLCHAPMAAAASCACLHRLEALAEDAPLLAQALAAEARIVEALDALAEPEEPAELLLTAGFTGRRSSASTHCHLFAA